ncbi:DNA gyrase C-terminal beta-propeller domain-containing protein [Candidatus Nardonella dryophthoridicola]|uniref:Uncharacterized protein n=1 Tax=endosymbiont of Metamasius hemipterus TaxID=204627 RepID=A0ABT0TWE5_9GAMM|nr:DNA gyrase C-terminal beta-propeller domain-containing protein [Candidatus Nardonella dryophthoridicola]MCM0158326.1 hypothetical protein [endosymbiont of Metamasius hemipterus]
MVKKLKSEYNEKSRLTLGSKLMKINDKTGKIIKSIVVNDKNDLFIINNLGMILKIKSIEIKVTKKNTMGVLLMNIKNKNEKIINIIKY